MYLRERWRVYVAGAQTARFAGKSYFLLFNFALIRTLLEAAGKGLPAGLALRRLYKRMDNEKVKENLQENIEHQKKMERDGLGRGE